jgi:hypothetical protein
MKQFIISPRGEITRYSGKPGPGSPHLKSNVDLDIYRSALKAKALHLPGPKPDFSMGEILDLVAAALPIIQEQAEWFNRTLAASMELLNKQAAENREFMRQLIDKALAGKYFFID